MTQKRNGIWVTWEFQRRNYGVSSALGWHFFEIDIKSPILIRYLKSLWKTTCIIYRMRPGIVAVQNPSILLAILAIFLKKFFNYKVVVDAHNSGIFPCEGKSKILMYVARWLQRMSDITIVTNSELKNVVEINGGCPIVLPDKVPCVPANVKEIPLEGKVKIVVISTFGKDEPYQNVLDAASLLKGDIVIYFTGKYLGKVDFENIPNNVKLLGFLPEIEFWSVLQSADLIMDLTLREGCLVCGAYEGVALKKPLILSNTRALKEYFSSGCVYTNSNPVDIAAAIEKAIHNLGTLQKEIALLNLTLQEDWLKYLDNFEKKLDSFF